MSYFTPGRTALVRHCRGGVVQAVRPCVVVSDDADGTLLWLPKDTPTRTSLFADGRPVRDVPLAERFTREWHTGPGVWTGTSALEWIPPGAPWHTVYWFFDGDGRFRNWYVNVETPPVRWADADSTAAGFDSDDLELDVVIAPDRSCVLKDEDELDAAVRAGDLSARVGDRTRLEASAAIDAATAGRPPFDGWLTDFRPDPGWTPPGLLAGWDRPVVSRTAEDLLSRSL
ncbi:DUF402 domain-containing protein [Cryptosporangium aurantiacum]|uniref:DUF402 domain-containing protein n=1 Tax=Cryptosporangium aurantiacum TaxID=134849 RepID=A0A1M7HVM3_9ACTN|nr:DUF402 domain-containing protein [Cryptosporangium aurantiacum]SHM32403.1 Protein of unknown function [Cryptosporangium aurantiacum]